MFSLTRPGIKMDFIETHRSNWSKSDGAGTYPWQDLLIQLGFPSGLRYFIVIFLCKLSSCSEQIIAVGSLKQNTQWIRLCAPSNFASSFSALVPILILSALYMFVTTLKQEKERFYGVFVGKMNTH